MVDVARVRMFDIPVGTFRWDNRYDVAQFEYDRNFVGKGLEPSPIMMPVRSGRVYSFGNLDRVTYKGLPGMLAASVFTGKGNVPADGIQCRHPKPGRPYQEHIIPDERKRSLESLSGIRHGICL